MEDNNMMYVVINGDGTGQTLGNAMSNNDIDALQSAQGSINDTHSQIEQWVQENGGQIISSSGDESIFTLPSEHGVHLDKLLSFYQNQSGHSATIGVGGSISEAVKAIVYGKNNGRGAISQYSPEMDGSDMGDEMPQEGDQSQDGEMSQEGMEGGQEDPNMQYEGENQQEPMKGEEGEVPEHEQGLSPEDKQMHDSTEDMSDEEEIDQENQAEKMNGMEGEQEPMEGEEGSYQADEDSSMPMEEGQQEPMEGEEEDEDSEGSLKNVLQSHLSEGGEDDMDEGQESPMDGEMSMEDGQSNNMEGEEPSMEGEMPMEEGQQEPMEGEMDGSDMGDSEGEEDGQMGDLKNEIGNALEQFKMNQEVLESHKESNPELYNAMLTMVGAMIHMSKMLGLDNMPEDMSAKNDDLESNEILSDEDEGYQQGK